MRIFLRKDADVFKGAFAAGDAAGVRVRGGVRENEQYSPVLVQETYDSCALVRRTRVVTVHVTSLGNLSCVVLSSDRIDATKPRPLKPLQLAQAFLPHVLDYPGSLVVFRILCSILELVDCQILELFL